MASMGPLDFQAAKVLEAKMGIHILSLVWKGTVVFQVHRDF